MSADLIRGDCMENDLVYRLLQKCKEYSQNSSCNRRQTGAALVLQTGEIYIATNGRQSDSCKEKGPDYCQRDDNIDTLEYITCPSLCAEGNVMLGALSENKDLTDSTLVTTDFPCQRCKDLIIHFHIGELYFAAYKEGVPRLYEVFYSAQMTSRGVSVNEIIELVSEEGDSECVIRTHKHDPGVEEFALWSTGTSGESWLRLMFDKKYKNRIRQRQLQMQARCEPVPDNFDGILMKVRL